MDGVLFGAKAYPDANLTDLDCETGETYIGLGHRAPGVFPIEATVADFRMYVGPALTDADVLALAFAPGTESFRACELPLAGADSAFTDAKGHPCAWYQEARKVVLTPATQPILLT